MHAEMPVIVRVASTVTAALLFGLVAFQIALAAGAPLGRAAYGGRAAELTTPLRVTSGVAAAVWAVAALAVLRRGGVTGWAPLPDGSLTVVMWVLVGLLAVSVVMNAITRSAVERAIWLPVTTVLLVGVLTVAIGSTPLIGSQG